MTTRTRLAALLVGILAILIPAAAAPAVATQVATVELAPGLTVDPSHTGPDTAPPGAVAPEPRYTGGAVVYNHSTLRLGAYRYWPYASLTTYDMFLPAGDSTGYPARTDNVAGVRFGPRAGGWCFYWAWGIESVNGHGTMFTVQLASNTGYVWGGLGTDRNAFHIDVRPRNYLTCPDRRY